MIFVVPGMCKIIGSKAHGMHVLSVTRANSFLERDGRHHLAAVKQGPKRSDAVVERPNCSSGGFKNLAWFFHNEILVVPQTLGRRF